MKTTKQRLMELAAINNPFLNEFDAFDQTGAGYNDTQEVQLVIKVKAGDLVDMFGGPEYMNVSDASTFKRFTDKVQDDLNNWFVGPGGDEWVNDGVESGEYDDFANL